MKNLNFLTIVGLLSISFLSGCSQPSVDSQDIKSSGFYAEMRTYSDRNDNTSVTAEFRLGNDSQSDYIMLSDSDTATVTVNGSTKELTEGDDFVYIAEFGTDVSNSEFVIALERSAEEDSSMPNSTVVSPRNIVIATPDENEIFESYETMTVTINADENDLNTEISVYGDCVDNTGEERYVSKSFTTSAPIETYTLSMEVLLGTSSYRANFNDSIPCDITVEVSRTRYGTVDSGYGKGGVISAVQERLVGIFVNP